MSADTSTSNITSDFLSVGALSFARLFLTIFSLGSMFFLGVVTSLGFDSMALIDKGALIAELLVYASIVSAIITALRHYMRVSIDQSNFILSRLSPTLTAHAASMQVAVISAIALAAILALIIASPENGHVILVISSLLGLAGVIIYKSIPEFNAPGLALGNAILALVAFLMGMAWLEQLKHKDPSFSARLISDEVRDIEIISSSGSGILVFANRSGSPEFIPWNVIKELHMAPPARLKASNDIVTSRARRQYMSSVFCSLHDLVPIMIRELFQRRGSLSSCGDREEIEVK